MLLTGTGAGSTRRHHEPVRTASKRSGDVGDVGVLMTSTSELRYRGGVFPLNSKAKWHVPQPPFPINSLNPSRSSADITRIQDSQCPLLSSRHPREAAKTKVTDASIVAAFMLSLSVPKAPGAISLRPRTREANSR